MPKMEQMSACPMQHLPFFFEAIMARPASSLYSGPYRECGSLKKVDAIFAGIAAAGTQFDLSAFQLPDLTSCVKRMFAQHFSGIETFISNWNASNPGGDIFLVFGKRRE